MVAVENGSKVTLYKSTVLDYFLKIALAIFTINLACCATPPELPDQHDSDKGQESSSFAAAMNYAYDTQKRYAEWLDDRLSFNFYSGIAEVALAGSALGVGAAGGSSAAVTALGTAAGATVALDQWVFGSPSKDPRTMAVANGIAQLQCVITDAWSAVPKAISLRPGTPAPPPDDLISIARGLAAQENTVVTDSTTIAAATDCSADETGAIPLAVAEASVSRSRSEAVRETLVGLPAGVASTVRAIHWQMYAQVAAGAPDISAIKITPTSSAPNPSKAPPNPNHAMARFRRAFQASSLCTGELAELKAQTQALNADLEGVLLPQSGFAECTKVGGASPPTNGGAGNTAPQPTPAPSKPAVTPLSVQPTSAYVKAGETAKIMVAGGNPPIFFTAVGPNVGVDVKPATSSGNEIDLTLLNGAKTASVLVTDMTGNETTVTLQLVQPVK